ncbi:DotA/TraY family protein [Thiotrichales bacterium 19X7-9]|nr:DotA/TraY family protein [Thiotrichales bacterium 19X7-9]
MSSAMFNSIAENDISQQVLQELFGVNLDTILSNNEPTTLFGVLFSYFNTGILAISFVIYAFIIIVGTVNTAKDGQFLGKNWSGHWISLRAIFGSVCAIPFKSGYCVAQYLIFAMVSCGISFADYLWKNVVHDTVSDHIPPVVSTQVSDNIKNYLALFMMSQLTENIIPNYTSLDTSSTKPCIKDSASDTISCKVSYQTDISNSFVKAYASPLIKAENPNGGTKPFEDYDDKFQQGITKWSDFSDSSYKQFELFKANWQGNYTIGDRDNSEKLNSVSKVTDIQNLPCLNEKDPSKKMQCILSYYNIGSSAQYLYHPELIPENSHSKDLTNITSQLIKSLEQKVTADIPVCDDSEGSICHDASKYGWWNADQLYLDFDNILSLNLKNLYLNFSDLIQSMKPGMGNNTIPVDYTGIDITYLSNYLSSDNLFGKIQQNYDASDTGLAFKTAHVSLNGYEDLVKSSGSFSVSLENVRDIFNHTIFLANGITYQDQTKAMQTCKDNQACQILVNKVNRLITDDTQFQYAQYLYVLSSLIKSDNPLYKDQAIKVLDNTIKPVLNLFSYFSVNHVNFSSNRGATDIKATIEDPSKQLLNDIFKSLLGGDAGDGSDISGLLADIYHIGDYDGDTEQSSFAAKNFSMVQNVQAIGFTLIEKTIYNILKIFDTATTHLDKIVDDAKVKADQLESKYSALSVSTSIFGSLIGIDFQSTSALMNLEFAKAMLETTIKLGEFSISLVLLPIVLFVLTTIFGIGVSFSLVIPLTPFILFWAGKVAWLLLVIEAMVAAPIVSLGLVYPEGHEVFGKSEPAIQITMSLILRPVFMIVGLIAGIGLTYIVIHFSADGFKAITNSLINFLPESSDGGYTVNWARGVFACLIIFMYATFLAMAFMKCFSLIYLIPDKVLQWIGNTRGERPGESEIQEFRSTATQTAQQGAQSATQAVNEGIQSYKSQAQSIQQGNYDVAKSEVNKNQAIAGDAGKVGNAVAKILMA